jgi:tetratricopeptide (TPR) repeat protein
MNGPDGAVSDFFVAGGILRPDTPSYVEREADAELLRVALTGQFAYVLTPRQMGKSSLMVRTAVRLRDQGVRTALIDLTAIGTGVSVEQWYLGLLHRLARELRLPVAAERWWAERAALAPVQRFLAFLRDVVLTECTGPVVIFIDEIDTTLSLPFSDDFFAAIRATYNARADDAAFNRLIFVLLGVATPADLVKDRRRTPFNIGQRIDLREFTRDEADVLRRGLQPVCGEHTDEVFDRIVYWTAGHPYLTQHLCRAVAEAGAGKWTAEQVDGLVAHVFLSEEGRKDTNLQFVRDRIATSPQRGRLLRLYRRVYRGARVPEDERSVDQNHLMLFGLVRAAHGVLEVRNAIYRQVFNLDWVQANLPADWPRRIVVVAGLIMVVLLVAGGYRIYQQQRELVRVQAQAAVDSFRATTSAEVRIARLVELLQLPGYADEARRLFYTELSPADQLAIFQLTNPRPLQAELTPLLRGLYTDAGFDPQGNALLAAMASTLLAMGQPDTAPIVREIGYWLQARTQYAGGDYAGAVASYGQAIGLNPDNPGPRFERGLAHAALGDHRTALADFEAVLRFGGRWPENVRQAVLDQRDLLAAVSGDRATYATLAALVLVATPTPTASPPPQATPTFTPLPPTPTMVATAELVEVKRDDFGSRTSGWDDYTAPDGAATVGYAGGRYFIRLQQDRFFVAIWSGAGRVTGNVVLQVRALGPFLAGGAQQQGLVFGWQIDQTAAPLYAFTVNRDGVCEFLEQDGALWFARVSGRAVQPRAGRLSQPRTLTVAIQSNQATGYVDGQFCAAYRLPNYRAGYVGLAASAPGGQGTAYFDDFRIYVQPWYPWLPWVQ